MKSPRSASTTKPYLLQLTALLSLAMLAGVSGCNATEPPQLNPATATISTGGVQPMLSFWRMGNAPDVARDDFSLVSHLLAIQGEKVTLIFSVTSETRGDLIQSMSLRLVDETGQDAYNPPIVMPLGNVEGIEFGAVTFAPRPPTGQQLHLWVQPPGVSESIETLLAEVTGPSPSDVPGSGAPHREGFAEQAGYRISFNGYALVSGDLPADLPSVRILPDTELPSQVATDAPTSQIPQATVTIVPLSDLARELSGGQPVFVEATLRIEAVEAGHVQFLYLVLLRDGQVRAAVVE